MRLVLVKYLSVCAAIGPALLLVALFAGYAMWKFRREYQTAVAEYKRSGANSLIKGVATFVEGFPVENGNPERGGQQGNRRGENARPIGVARQEGIGGGGNALGGTRNGARHFLDDVVIGIRRFADGTSRSAIPICKQCRCAR